MRTLREERPSAEQTNGVVIKGELCRAHWEVLQMRRVQLSTASSPSTEIFNKL